MSKARLVAVLFILVAATAAIAFIEYVYILVCRRRNRNFFYHETSMLSFFARVVALVKP